VFDLFSRHTSNPWIEKDRKDARKIILMVVGFIAVLGFGIGMLIYALAQG